MYLVDSTLTINYGKEDDSDEIALMIRIQAGKEKRCRTQAVSARTTPVTITVIDANKQPVIGANVKLTVERASVAFGGHDHDAAFTTVTSTRPLGALTDALGITNAQGVFSTVYAASAFSSEDKIVATVTSGTGSGTGMSGVVTAQVSGLFRFVPSTPHVSIGGTCHHYGPNAIDKKCRSSLDHNHFATSATNAKISKLLSLYNQYHAFGLLINDMSLKEGGLFDVRKITRWIPSHFSHRRGIDMDMHTEDVKGNVVKGRLLKLNKDSKGKLFRDILDEGNHLHVYF